MMKRVILGSVMLISGALGFVGLMVSHAIKVESGHAYKGISELIFERSEDSIFAVSFILLAVAGIIIGVLGAAREEKE